MLGFVWPVGVYTQGSVTRDIRDIRDSGGRATRSPQPVVRGRACRLAGMGKPLDGGKLLGHAAAAAAATCHARSKRTGSRCQRPPVPGKAVCYYHGGAPGSGRPPIHGRYSRSLGKAARLYEQALEDGRLFDLREPLAVLDALVQRQLALAVEKDSPSFRREVLKQAQALADHAEAGAPGAAGLARQLAECVERGAAEAAALAGAGEALERFCRRLEGAWAVRLHKSEAISREEVVAALARLLVIVREEAGDEVALRVHRRVEAAASQAF